MDPLNGHISMTEFTVIVEENGFGIELVVGERESRITTRGVFERVSLKLL